MKINSTARVVFSILSICVLLSACGGGGGGSSSGSTGSQTPSTNPTTTPVTTTISLDPLSAAPGTLILASPPAPTYTGEELAAYTTFNTARSDCGFGYLRQNSHLDTSAANHIAWMVDNNTASHYEVAATPGYTGVNPWDRMTAAGYAWSLADEVMASISTANKTGWGSSGARELLAAPYHLKGLMWGELDIGISVKSGSTSGADINAAGAAPISWLVADMGAPSSSNGQAQASTDILTYPCQGVTNTAWEMQGESPSPIPSRNFSTNPIGQPVFVQAVHGNTLTITSASMIGPSGSVTLLPTMTASNDPNSEVYSNQAIIMPNAPLTPNTTYSVNITGTNNTTPFSRSFTFTTGS